MNKCKKLIALLLSVLFVLPLGVLGVFAEDSTTTSPLVNLVTAENTTISADTALGSWPLARLVDGVKAYNSSFGTYAVTTSYGGDNITHYQFDFAEAITINHIKTFLSNQELAHRNRDYAVDVMLESGAWIRVAEEHNTEAKYAALAEKLNNPDIQDYHNDGTHMYRSYTFPTVTAKAFRISANCKRVSESGVGTKGFHMLEIEAYLDENVTEYTGVESPDNANYAIANRNFAHATFADQWYDYAYVMGTVSSNSPHPSFQITNANDEAYPNQKGTIAVAQYDSTTNTAWYQIDFSTAITVNAAKIYAPDQVPNVPADYTVDVKNSDGIWERVVEVHGLSTATYRNFYFAPKVGVTAIRVSANRNGNTASGNFMLRSLHIGFLPEKTVSDYTGVTATEDATLAIPAVRSDNLALNATATISDTLAGSSTSANDGVTTGGWVAARYNAAGLAWYQLDFEKELPVSFLKIYAPDESAKVPADYAIDVKTVGGYWKRVVEVHGLSAVSERKFYFEPVNAISVRVTANRHGNSASGNFMLREIEIYYDPATTTYTGINKTDDSALAIPEYISDNYALDATITTTSLAVAGSAAYMQDGNTRYDKEYASVGAKNCIAFFELSFAVAKPVNKVVFYQTNQEWNLRPEDYSVDVMLANGTWKRVAAVFDSANNSDWGANSRTFTFATETVTKVRVSASIKRIKDTVNNATTHVHCVELQSFYDPSVAEYTGVATVDNWKYDILAVDHVKGDQDGNGAVDSNDLVASKKTILGVAAESLKADVNSDFVINILDYVATAKEIAE